MTTSPFTRRRALAGAASVGLSLPLLSACSDDLSGPSSTPTSAPPDEPTSTPTSESAPTSPSEEPTSEAPEGGAGPGIVSTGDVPVGSGVILAESAAVVTQPSEGVIKVFSNVCTHSGCPVTGITDVIDCSCHGSSYDIATGEVLGGPAPDPLPPLEFRVERDQVVLA